MVHVVKAGRCGSRWTAHVEGRERQAAEEPGEGGHGAAGAEHSLSLSAEVLPEPGSAELPCLHRDSDLPLTPWNVCLEACSEPASSARCV